MKPLCLDCGLDAEHCSCPKLEITRAEIPEWKSVEDKCETGSVPIVEPPSN